MANIKANTVSHLKSNTNDITDVKEICNTLAEQYAFNSSSDNYSHMFNRYRLKLEKKTKLSFIPHITSLKSRCTKSLDLIKVLSNTTWGADIKVLLRFHIKVLLRLYRALIRSKLDYGCIVYGSVIPSYIKRLDWTLFTIKVY